ncbi:MAG: PQQ-binding-like beta-propeller repeat protein [Actinomycetota bacterium]
MVQDAIGGEVRCEAWISRFNDPAEEYDGPVRGNRAMATSPDGATLYVAGNSDPDEAGDDLDALLVAYDSATGQQRWVGRYEGEGEAKPWAIAYAMDVSPTGEAVYVLANATPLPSGPADSFLLSFDATTGALVWKRPLLTPWGERAAFSSLQVARDGSRVYATGNAFFNDAEAKKRTTGVTTAFEARDPEHLGEQIWTTPPLGAVGSFLRHVAVSADGSRVFAGGSLLRANGRRDGFTTIGYEADTGSRLWQAHEPGAFPDDLGIPAMAGLDVSPDGSKVFITGADQLPEQGSSSFHVIFVIAYDAASGDKLWGSKIAGEYPTGGDGTRSGLFIEVGSPIEVAPDGSAVYVAGTLSDLTSQGVPLQYAIITVALDSGTGAEIWRNEFDEGRPRRTFWPFLPAIAVSGEEVFVTATRSIEVVVPFVTAQYEDEYSTVALDAGTGVENWVGRWGEGRSRTGGIAVAPDGERVFVAGETLELTERIEGSWDLVTVAYDTD